VKELRKSVFIKFDPLAPDPTRTFEKMETEHPEVALKWIEEMAREEDERIIQHWVRKCDRKFRKQDYRTWKSLQNLPIKARVIKMSTEKGS
jgi:hypothetical protein